MNLIWVQLEAYGALNDEKNKILESALEQIDFDTINLAQTVCAAPSTVMSTMGLLTGVSPVLLAKDHIPKRKQVPDDWQAVGFTTITDFLEKQNYDVIGINAVFDSPRCLPMFKDTHAGVTENMSKKEGYNFWEAWCIPQRLRNIIPSLKNENKAFFFHLIDADILPEIIQELKDLGLNKSNTVMVLVGDHGWPIRFKEKEPALFHDLHQEENNIRVTCHMAYPGSLTSEYTHFSSALDLAPTTLDIMGFDSKKVLPKANGLSLIQNLIDNSPFPERLIRIDNRYIAQRKNKVITLVNSRLRYTFRYETNWEQQPYYQYRFKPVSDKEELYLREDIEEKNNLINNRSYKSDLEAFRNFLRKSETEVLKHFYPEDVFEHFLLSGHFHDIDDESSSRLHSNARIQKILLKLLNKKLIETNLNKVALYGAGNHTRSILNQKIINSKVSVIFDDNPLFEEIDEIPVIHPNKKISQQYDALIISSDYFEPQLEKRAKDWLPKNQKLLTIYKEIGESLSHLLLRNDFDSCEALLIKVLSVIEPENILSLNESFSKHLSVKNAKVYSPADNYDYSYKSIVGLFPENKFDLITYKTKNIFELSEWLSRVDELLDTCGIFFAAIDSEIPINKKDLSRIITRDFKMDILAKEDSIIILGHLWRFNS